jgi:hypothetical protein
MSENFYNILNTDSESDSEIFEKNDIKNNNFKKKKFDYAIKRNTWVNERKEKKINHKKILCQNVILNGSCMYTDRCLYAHKIDEQKIDIKRKKIFDLLDSTCDLSFIDINKHNDIYKEFLLFTKPCLDCLNNKCTGGNNCKFGSPNIKYIVCYDDLNYGKCEDLECNRKHLSKRGLKPICYNISLVLTQPVIDNISMIQPIFNNLLLINNIERTYRNLTNDNSDISDEECDKSIFNSKYDLLD